MATIEFQGKSFEIDEDAKPTFQPIAESAPVVKAPAEEKVEEKPAEKIEEKPAEEEVKAAEETVVEGASEDDVPAEPATEEAAAPKKRNTRKK